MKYINLNSKDIRPYDYTEIIDECLSIKYLDFCSQNSLFRLLCDVEDNKNNNNNNDNNNNNNNCKGH